MHFVIMGCGRVGASLARTLDDLGHSLTIIDRDPDAFRRLGSGFGGKRVTGEGFDRDVLRKAETDRAAAFAAVSSGDNSNIIAARIVREVFGVSNVVARIYDMRRAEVYERLGIPTVATVRWTADQMLCRLLPSGSGALWRDPTGTVELARLPVAESWLGEPVARLQAALGEARVVFLTRLGRPLPPSERTVLQDGDQVHVLMPVDQIADAEAAAQRGPASAGERRDEERR